MAEVAATVNATIPTSQNLKPDPVNDATLAKPQSTTTPASNTASNAPDLAAAEAAKVEAQKKQKHTCYVCFTDAPKKDTNNWKLSLKLQDADKTPIKPQLHYETRRFRVSGREIHFLDDSEWVWPWTKGVQTQYCVRFVTFPAPKVCVPATSNGTSAPELLTICGSCIRSEYPEVWGAIKAHNAEFV